MRVKSLTQRRLPDSPALRHKIGHPPHPQLQPDVSILKPEETGLARRRKDDLILQVREIEHGQVRHVRPVGRSQVGILLQPEVHGGNDPRNH